MSPFFKGRSACTLLSIILFLLCFFFQCLFGCIGSWLWHARLLCHVGSLLWCRDSLVVGSVVMAWELSCSTTCRTWRILVPWLWIKPASPTLQGRFLVPSHPFISLAPCIFALLYLFSSPARMPILYAVTVFDFCPELIKSFFLQL